MKSDREIKLYTVAVLEALSEGGGGAPAGHVYMGLQHGGVHMDDFRFIERIVTGAGWVTVAGHYWTLTEKGRAVVNGLALAKP